MKKEILWSQIERPKTIQDCILPENIKAQLQEFVNNKSFPNLLFSGNPGIGKTTAAIALCEEIGCDYIKINGSKENGIDTLRTRIQSYASSVSFKGGRKVIILDEADGLSAQMQDGLRSFIEDFSAHCSFILTCNFKSKLSKAIADSRLATIEFKIVNGQRVKLAVEFLKKVESILESRSISYDRKDVTAVIQKFFPDFRKTLNELQASVIDGKLEVSSADLDDTIFKELVSLLKEKNFTGSRKWIGKNVDSDYNRLFRKLYDSSYDVLKPESIPQLVLTIADYQYKAAFVVDQEINFMACLTEIMGNCEFK